MITQRSLISAKIRLDGYGAKSRWGPLRVYLRVNGVLFGSKKWVETVKITMPEIRIFTIPWSSISTKIRLDGFGPKSRWGPLRVHLGANGVLFGSKKWIKTVNNYHARNSNFQLHCSHRFRPKFEFRVMAPNHGWDPLRSILGPMGSHWVQKWVKTVNNYHAPKFEFSTTPRSSISAKIRLQGSGAKSRWGPPNAHLGANGVPLGPKNGSKP